MTYQPLDGDGFVAPGVEVVVTAGHAPGHQSVVVHMPDSGAVLLAGDAINSRMNLQYDSWSHNIDPVTARESAARLVGLASRLGARLVFSHDVDQIRELPTQPNQFLN